MSRRAKHPYDNGHDYGFDNAYTSSTKPLFDIITLTDINHILQYDHILQKQPHCTNTTTLLKHNHIFQTQSHFSTTITLFDHNYTLRLQPLSTTTLLHTDYDHNHRLFDINNPGGKVSISWMEQHFGTRETLVRVHSGFSAKHMASMGGA